MARAQEQHSLACDARSPVSTKGGQCCADSSCFPSSTVQQPSRQEAHRGVQVSQVQGSNLVPGRKRAAAQGPERVTAAPELNALSPHPEMDMCCRTTEHGLGDISIPHLGKANPTPPSLFPCLFLYLMQLLMDFQRRQMKRWNKSAGLALYCRNTCTSSKRAIVPAPSVPLVCNTQKGSEHPSSSWDSLRVQPRFPAGMQSAQLRHVLCP